MPLTPADIRNVAFSKPPIGKRGYNEEEVDAFLDLVGAELARLIEQNYDLRNLVAQRDRQFRAAPVDSGRDLRDHDAHAAKVLGLAQQIADRLAGDAKEEADGMLREARMRSEQLLAGASVLEQKVDELRTFEHDYRTRVKTCLESQLRELDLRAFVVPASAARNQPDLPVTGFSVPADSGSHRTDPAIGRAAADVAILPARNVALNTETIDVAGMSEIQWEPAV